jgi:hypothetical protein
MCWFDSPSLARNTRRTRTARLCGAEGACTQLCNCDFCIESRTIFGAILGIPPIATSKEYITKNHLYDVLGAPQTEPGRPCRACDGANPSCEAPQDLVDRHLGNREPPAKVPDENLALSVHQIHDLPVPFFPQNVVSIRALQNPTFTIRFISFACGSAEAGISHIRLEIAKPFFRQVMVRSTDVKVFSFGAILCRITALSSPAG